MIKENRGFTLIELMVVMTIIAILAGFALVSLGGSRKAARDGRRKADLEQVRSALEMRRADCGSYPTTAVGDDIHSGENITGTDLSASCQVCCDHTVYMTIPSDPNPSNPSRQYVYTGLANSYALCAALETGGSATGCGSCDVSCNYKTTEP